MLQTGAAAPVIVFGIECFRDELNPVSSRVMNGTDDASFISMNINRIVAVIWEGEIEVRQQQK